MNEVPHSIESERAIIGGLLIDNSRWDLIGDVVKPEDFYNVQNRAMFSAVRDMIEVEGETVDVVTLSEFMQSRGVLEDVGGLAALSQIASEVYSAANIKAYANIVRDRAIRRGVLQALDRSAQMLNANLSTPELLSAIQSEIMALSESATSAGASSAREAIHSVLDVLDRRTSAKNGLIGLTTGFVDLDVAICGLVPTDLVIVAARPSAGKTTLAMNMAETNAAAGKTVLVFSLEMGKEQLLMRAIASRGRVDFQNLRSANMNDEEWQKVVRASAQIADHPLWIDDTAGLSIGEMRVRARRLKRERGLDLVVVDYIQQASGEGNNRNDQVEQITRGLKQMAKELHVPVIALSQLNRKLEQRPNKRPVMSDLRDSGAIEQDADVILFLYRDEIHNENSPSAGVAEVIIGKQRNGPLGKIYLAFNGHHCQFNNHAGYHEPMEVTRTDTWTGGFQYDA